MAIALHLRRLTPDHIAVRQRSARIRQGQRGAFHDCAAQTVISCVAFDIGKEHRAIFGEIRMQDEVTHAALPARIDSRRIGDLAKLLALSGQQPDVAHLLGNNGAAIRHEGHRPCAGECFQRCCRQLHSIRARYDFRCCILR